MHIALEVDETTLNAMFAKGKAQGIHTRGVSDHGFVRSIYFRDPNGYVIELTTKSPQHDDMMAREAPRAHEKLKRWQENKSR